MTTTPPTCTTECTAEQLRAFSILNDIRDMGICNMFGAVSPLMKMGGYSRPEAVTYLREWMQWGHELTTS